MTILEPSVEMPLGFGVRVVDVRVRAAQRSFVAGEVVQFDIGNTKGASNNIFGSIASGTFLAGNPTTEGVRTGKLHAVLLADLALDQVGPARLLGEVDVFAEGVTPGVEGYALVIDVPDVLSAYSDSLGGGVDGSFVSAESIIRAELSGGSSAPPSGGSSAPPSGGSSAPPSGGSSTPPSGGSSAPPSGGSSGGGFGGRHGKRIRGIVLTVGDNSVKALWDGVRGFGYIYG